MDQILSDSVHADKVLLILGQKRRLTRMSLMPATSLWTLGGRRLVRQYPFPQKPFANDVLIDRGGEVLETPVRAYSAQSRFHL